VIFHNIYDKFEIFSQCDKRNYLFTVPLFEKKDNNKNLWTYGTNNKKWAYGIYQSTFNFSLLFIVTKN